ncbi:MAG: hypothetical protein ACXAE3_04295 [Candidatus Kariarchaeaceae archaeon]
MAKRLLFLDFLRGIAMMILIIVHVLVHGVWFYPEIALALVPGWVLIVLGPLVIFATWAGIFAIVSGLASVYNLHDQVIIRGKPFWQAAKVRLFNSSMVLVGHLIYVTLTAHRRNIPYPGVIDQEEIHTIITGSAENLTFYWPPDWMFFFFADAIGMIAMSGFISVFVIWIAWKINGKDNHNRNYKMILAVSLVWLAVSIPVWNWGYLIIIDLLKNGSFGALVLAKLMSFFFGAFQPMFPLAGFTMMGVVVGLLLAENFRSLQDPEYTTDVPDVRQFIKRWAGIFFLLFIFFLVIDLTVNGKAPLEIFEYKVIPYTLFTFNMSMMLLSILALLNWFEYKSYDQRVAIAKRTVFVRRFGLVSLTIYLTESVVNGFFSSVFHLIFDDPSTPDFQELMLNGFGITLYVIVVFGLWLVFLSLWEQSGFKYGAEYWIVRIGNSFRESKSIRLDLATVLHNPIPEREKEWDLAHAD